MSRSKNRIDTTTRTHSQQRRPCNSSAASSCGSRCYLSCRGSRDAQRKMRNRSEKVKSMARIARSLLLLLLYPLGYKYLKKKITANRHPLSLLSFSTDCRHADFLARADGGSGVAPVEEAFHEILRHSAARSGVRAAESRAPLRTPERSMHAIEPHRRDTAFRTPGRVRMLTVASRPR